MSSSTSPATRFPVSRAKAALARRLERQGGDEGISLVEVLIASTLLVVLLTVVMVTMGMVDNVSTAVDAQSQEYQQALPSLQNLQSLIRAEVEPAPSDTVVTNCSGAFTMPVVPGFGYGPGSYPGCTTSPSIGNYSLAFYANIGTSNNNVTTDGTPAGPALILAEELDCNGNPVVSTAAESQPTCPNGKTTWNSATQSSTCSVDTPCSFQVRQYLPVTNDGVSTCPGVGNGTQCQFPCPSSSGTTNPICDFPGTGTYKLITNVQDVVNNPAVGTDAADESRQAIFSYGFFDAGSSTSQVFDPGDVQSQTLTTGAWASTNLPILSCGDTAAARAMATTTLGCPADGIQSVSVNLMIGIKGSGVGGTPQIAKSQAVIYRYSGDPWSSTNAAPYQYDSSVG